VTTPAHPINAWAISFEVVMKRRLLQWALALSVLHLGVSSLGAARLDADTNLTARSPLHQIRDEADPTDQQSCESMGQMGIVYETGNAGPPNIGLRITDPRGRKIGYDPRTPKVWQDLPLADGFVECNELDEKTGLKHCAAHIQICGPVSGTYKLEVLPTQNGTYSITAMGTSESKRDQSGVHSTASRAQYRSEIRKQSPEVLTLSYSREAGTKISLGRNDAQVATSDKSRAKPSAR
jgi:hypothetical protein